MGLGAKRRSKEPGAQAQLNVYPHLRSLGPVAVKPMRVPQGRSKIVFEEDNSIGFAGLAIFFQAAWLAGIWFKIPVLANLGVIPVIVAPAAAVLFGPNWFSRLRTVSIATLAVPLLVVVIAAFGLGLGAGIAYFREGKIDWIAMNWQSVLDGQMKPFMTVWTPMLMKAAPGLALAGLLRMILDVVRR